MNNPKKIIITDADGFATNTQRALVVLAISRFEIESGNFGSALERLHVMTDSAENVLRYHESLLIQVEGYDSDPRELPEIPEVCSYFKRLIQQWPHWLWFMRRGTGTIALLLTLLCQVRVVRGKGIDFGTEFIDTKEVGNVLKDLFSRGFALFETYDIPDTMVEESVDSVLAELNWSTKT